MKCKTFAISLRAFFLYILTVFNVLIGVGFGGFLLVSVFKRDLGFLKRAQVIQYCKKFHNPNFEVSRVKRVLQSETHFIQKFNFKKLYENEQSKHEFYFC